MSTAMDLLNSALLEQQARSNRMIDVLTQTIGKLAESLENVVKRLDLCGTPDCGHPACLAQLDALRGLRVVVGLEKRLEETGLSS